MKNYELCNRKLPQRYKLFLLANQEDLEKLLTELKVLSKETEWVEFKVDHYDPQEIGEYISALSNSACLHHKEKGYLVFGIEDKTHNVMGTHIKPKQKKVRGEELEHWLARQLNPRIDFVIHEFPYSGQKKGQNISKTKGLMIAIIRN